MTIHAKCFLCGKAHRTESAFFKCVEKYDKKGMVDWYSIGVYQTLSESFIERFQNRVYWSLISQCQILSESFIERFQNRVYWSLISQYQILSESFIERFQNMVNWLWISQCQILSESFIERFKDKVNWSLISQYQILSESFIERFKDKVNWYEISQYQILSKSFIERFQDKLNLDVIKDKKKNHISISEYAKKHNLEIDDKYLYAYRNHDKRGAGLYKLNSRYKKGIYYRDWHCDTNPNNENSYGFGIWPEGNTKVRIKLEDWGTAVYTNSKGKGRVWGFEII